MPTRLLNTWIELETACKWLLATENSKTGTNSISETLLLAACTQRSEVPKMQSHSFSFRSRFVLPAAPGMKLPSCHLRPNPQQSAQEPVKTDDEDRRGGIEDAGGTAWRIAAKVQ